LGSLHFRKKEIRKWAMDAAIWSSDQLWGLIFHVQQLRTTNEIDNVDVIDGGGMADPEADLLRSHWSCAERFFIGHWTL